MKRTSQLSITADNAQPNYDAEEDLAKLDARNAKAAVRTTYFQIGLGTVLIVIVFLVGTNWESIVQFFRK